MATDAPTDLPGIDRAAIGSWLDQQLGGPNGPYDLALVAGGRSNLTFIATAADGRRSVLRRPPLGRKLASAHDMEREYRILSGLSGTAVPVPEPLALRQDPDEAEATIYAMEYVDGLILRTETDVVRHFPPERRSRLAEALVDVLAELHAIDPDAVGLGDLGPREGYVQRQLRRWQRQWEQSRTRELTVVDDLHRRLAAAAPPARIARPAIVHGDYRIENIVFTADGDVAAVLDWELCTLGDPLADVGLLAAFWGAAQEPGHVNVLTGTLAALPGFPDCEAVLDRYARRAQADLGEVDFYVALGYWKLACICEGVYARYRDGAMGERPDDVDLTALADQVERFAVAGNRALDGFGRG